MKPTSKKMIKQALVYLVAVSWPLFLEADPSTSPHFAYVFGAFMSLMAVGGAGAMVR